MRKAIAKTLAGLAALAFALVGAGAAVAQGEGSNAEEVPEPTITPLEISFSATGFSGPGAAWLRAEIEQAQFVAIGEDHGFADAPALVAAFAAEGAQYGLDRYVIEVGPHSTDWLREHLRDGGADALARELSGRPLAVPFLNLREEAEVAARFAADGKLWGIDQEFIGSPLIHLEWLGERDGANTDAARSLYETEREAFAAGNQGAVLMVTAGADQWRQLEEDFANDPQALAILTEMQRSQAVYQSYFGGRGFDNNYDRVALIREYFLDHYSAARANGEAAPRAIFKVGATHAGRATSPMSTFDIGSLIEGIAAGNGLDALHLAYLPLGGEKIGIRPSADGPFLISPVDEEDTRAALVAAGVDMSVIDGNDGHFIIPLEPVRRAMGNRGLREAKGMFRFVVLGFDYLITTSTGRPATPLTE